MILPRTTIALLLATTPVRAQEPTLPRLLQLGPLPAAPTSTLHLAPGRPSAEAAIPDDTPHVVLRCHPSTSIAQLTAVLQSLHEHRVAEVYFAATLPNGTEGGIGLALPDPSVPTPALTLRAHAERPGIPAASATSLLHKLRNGVEATGEPFVLAIELAGDATITQLLPLLAAAAMAGCGNTVVKAGPNAGIAERTSLALDLVGVLPLQVRAMATPTDKPTVRTTPLRCGPWRALPAAPARSQGHNGPRAARPVLPPDPPASYLGGCQLPDGSFPDAGGKPDLEATALLALAMLGDGAAEPESAWHADLHRCVGWLIAAQRDDGSFEDPGEGSLRRHAQATYALTEASGLSPHGALVRGSATAALQWLDARRDRDGYLGTPAGKAPATTTAWATLAVASAEFFRFPLAGKAIDFLPAFDGRDPAPGAAAAELCSRYVAGQEPRTTPRLDELTTAVSAQRDASDPETAFWTTFALFQRGGRPWLQWSEHVGQTIAKSQVGDGSQQGTWAPVGGHGRLTTTAFNLLTLQAYYRHTRLVR